MFHTSCHLCSPAPIGHTEWANVDTGADLMPTSPQSSAPRLCRTLTPHFPVIAASEYRHTPGPATGSVHSCQLDTFPILSITRALSPYLTAAQVLSPTLTPTPQLSSILPPSLSLPPPPAPFLPTPAAAAADEPTGLAGVYLGKVFRPAWLPSGQQG